MIHFAIGTKAQFIKMAPIMHLLQEDGESYHLLDLSQHGSLTGKILEDFGLNPLTTRLGKSDQSVTTYMQAVKWLAAGFSQILFHRNKIAHRLFNNQPGVALIHGDTLSTLLGHYLAKSAGLRTGLVEAGLTSGDILDPFPEEWIRQTVSKKSDYLFVPDDISEATILKRKYRGRLINTGYNTGKDALYLVRSKFSIPVSKKREEKSYSVVTLHRFETISRRKRLERAVRYIVAVSEVIGPLHFYMHPPTENALKSTGLLQLLVQSGNITIRGLSPYSEFIRVISGARFVLSDGGSIQEETSYLNRPCLLLRNKTERQEGIKKNVILSTWNAAKDIADLMEIENNVLDFTDFSEMGASRKILETLEKYRAKRHA